MQYQERKREVQTWLEESQQQELQKEKQQDLMYAQQSDSGVRMLGEQFREDAPKLGEKKTWKPSQEQQRQNLKIDEAKQLTAKATAYTVELHTALHEQTERWQKEAEQGYHPAWKEAAFQLLYSTQFDKRMLSTANLRKHFSEYMELIHTYDRLEGYTQKTREDTYRLERIAPQMTILKQRMESFLGQNRLDLDGHVLADDAEPAAFQYTKEVNDRMKPVLALGRPDYDLEALEAERDAYAKEDLAALLKEGDYMSGALYLNALEHTEEQTSFDQDMYALPDLATLTQLSARERIGYIRGMRTFVLQQEATVRELEEQLSHPPAHTEDDADAIAFWENSFKEELARLRRDIIEVKACLVLAEAEAHYLTAETKDEKYEAKNALIDAWHDMWLVRGRTMKESLPLTTIATEDERIQMTRERAINSPSDQANYAFKNKMLEAAQTIPNVPELEGFRQRVLAYARATHYSVGPEEEVRLLKEVLKERKRLEKSNAPGQNHLRVIDSLLYTLQNGSRPVRAIPVWDQIPPELKIDCVDPFPEGKPTIDQLSESELAKRDHLPKEDDVSKQKGSFVNAAIVSARKWVKLPADEPLFAHEPTINDLRQGKVSNCFMLAGTTGLIHFDPQIIKDCIRDNGDGTVTVRLYRPSKQSHHDYYPVFVRIPKRIPKMVTGGDVLSSGALWMQLIERAAAQVGMFRRGRQGYQSLWYGKGDEWLTILTGKSGNTVATADGTRARGFESDSDLFEKLASAKADGYIYHAGSKSEGADGINSGHAYTILGVRTQGEQRYVTLRNPYANMSRVVDEKGQVSLSTTYLSSTADATCGQFDMPFEEFLNVMQTISRTNMNMVPAAGKSLEEIPAYEHLEGPQVINEPKHPIRTLTPKSSKKSSTRTSSKKTTKKDTKATSKKTTQQTTTVKEDDWRDGFDTLDFGEEEEVKEEKKEEKKETKDTPTEEEQRKQDLKAEFGDMDLKDVEIIDI
ncbi:MAG: hypothetical protein IJT34_00080 [Butyrivibrio sp.]|nr:hypothetical protein [Butyrivibrio sp.]